MASITLQQVTKSYSPQQAAVRDLTLDIADGELVVLVGPSGSGKSTALRLIAGLEAPTSGRILIGDEDVTHVPPQHRDLAMVFQHYALYPHKSVRENLAFGLRIRRLDPARIDERVKRTASALGLEALLDRKPAQLSGGERQRVALGRAIVREPRAFLLDEPLSNLDPILRVATRTELALMHRRLGATMVYVTHDQEEAMTLGTRVGVMRDGALEQLAPAHEVFQRPANAFVAQFVGSPAMNLWPGQQAPADTVPPFLRAMYATLSDQGRMSASEGSALLLGVRPHDIELVAPGDGEGTGRVEIIELLGPVIVIHLRLDGLGEELVRVVAPAETRIAIDDRTGVRVRRDRLHLFDRSTGRRRD